MKNKILFPNDSVISTKNFEVSQDWEFPIPGFFILSPKRKMRSVSEFNDDEAIEFIMLLREVRKGMKDVLGIEDVYFFHNEDTEHNFHVWIFPRHEWMERFGRGINSVKPIMEYAKKEMAKEDIIKEVKEAVKKMKSYMHNFNLSILQQASS